MERLSITTLTTTESELLDWLRKNLDCNQEQSMKIVQELLQTSRLRIVYPAVLEFEHNVGFSTLACLIYQEPLLRLQYHVPSDYLMNNAKIWLLPARPASVVAAQLNGMIYLLYDRFLDDKTGLLDIAGLKKSREFVQFCIATAELQKVVHYSSRQPLTNCRLIFRRFYPTKNSPSS